MALRIVKKQRANLTVCLKYGYVCKAKFAKKFKILERRIDVDRGKDSICSRP